MVSYTHTTYIIIPYPDLATVVSKSPTCIAHYTLVGKYRFMAVKASFLATGLTTRAHGNTQKLPKLALKLDMVKPCYLFIQLCGEEYHPPPSRIPRYKQDDLQLLPSNTTMKVNRF